MKKVFSITSYLTDKEMHYCPGCTHGIVHRIVGEVLEEMEAERVIGVAPVGCAVFAYEYFNFDCHQAAHGRAPAVATGIKRVHKDALVFTYQGDGDLASIGAGEIVNAAGRGENITVIFINNAIYGMTGGQLAPTSLVGQKTTTSPYGRKPDECGYPLTISEMLATQQGAYYIERTSVHDVPNINKTKKAIRKAFEAQKAGKGFSMIEILSTCPTNWGMTPVESLKWVEESMMEVFPLGVYKDGDK